MGSRRRVANLSVKNLPISDKSTNFATSNILKKINNGSKDQITETW